MSEDGGATPAPFVLDVSVLTAVTPRGLWHHDQLLHVIEIADPDEAPAAPGQGALGARSDTRPRHLAVGLACFSVTKPK